MGTKTLYFDKCAGVSFGNQTTNYTPGPIYDYSSAGITALLFGVSDGDAIINEIKYKKLLSVKVHLYVRSLFDYWSKDPSVHGRIKLLRKEFDEKTVTYITSGLGSYLDAIPFYTYSDAVPGYQQGEVFDPDDIEGLIRYGGAVSFVQGTIDTPFGINPPYLFLEYGDEDVGVRAESLSPTAGSILSRLSDSTFQWRQAIVDYPILASTISLSAQKFRWRKRGETTYNEQLVPNQSSLYKSIIVPAGTFETGGIEWQVEIETESGVVTTSDWIPLEVQEPVPSSTIASPRNAAVNGSEPITFSWNHIIANSSPQFKFDLQTSADNASWSTLISENTAKTSVTVAANTFDAGDLYWRIRTYNQDGVNGDWSESAHCIIIASPDTPNLFVTKNEPRFSVLWQQTGQQAYELQLDGKTISKKFGVETRYLHNDYLPDGEFPIRVRIQNSFSLWSDWAEAAVVVENQPGIAIHLFAESDEAVSLNWDGADVYSEYWVYRNNKKIASTTDRNFTDHFAVDHASYQVRGIYSDSGYYTMSNVVEVDASVPEMMIAEIEYPQWLRLGRSENSLRSTSFSSSRSVTYKNYIGAALPSAEIGEHINAVYQFDAAWETGDPDIDAFERMLGKLVCIKTTYRRCIVGILNPISRRANRLITSISASVTLVDWQEV